MIDPRVSKLPVWARNMIVGLTNQADRLTDRVERLTAENTRLSGPPTDLYNSPPPGIYRDVLNGNGTGLLLPDYTVTVVGSDPRRTIFNVQVSQYGTYINGRDMLSVRPEASNTFRVVGYDR